MVPPAVNISSTSESSAISSTSNQQDNHPQTVEHSQKDTMSGDGETFLLDENPSSEEYIIGSPEQSHNVDDIAAPVEVSPRRESAAHHSSLSSLKQTAAILAGGHKNDDTNSSSYALEGSNTSLSMSRSSSAGDIASMKEKKNSYLAIPPAGPPARRAQSLEAETHSGGGMVRVSSHGTFDGEITDDDFAPVRKLQPTPSMSSRTILKRRSSLSASNGVRELQNALQSGSIHSTNSQLNTSRSSLGVAIAGSSEHRNDNAVLELESLLVEPPSNISRRSEEILASEPGMTVNQLRFFSNNDNGASLIGRQRERETLKQCFQRAQTMRTRELVLISGYSGCGKTALALTLQKEIASQKARRTNRNVNESLRPAPRGALRILGKFDLYMHEPYAGFVGACRELCNELLALPKSAAPHVRTIGQQLYGQLEPDNLNILTKMIPELQQVLAKAETGSSGSTKAMGTGLESNIRDHHRSESNVRSHRRRSFKAFGSAANMHHELAPVTRTSLSNVNNGTSGGGGAGGAVTSANSIVDDVENYLSGVYVDDFNGGEDYDEEEGENNNNHANFHLSGLQEAKKRIAYCFSQFFQIISQSYSCLIVQMDDLQWADPGSLDLIQSLLGDTSLRKFMIVGCYRSNEVQDRVDEEKNRITVHPVNKMVVQLAPKSAKESNVEDEEEAEDPTVSSSKSKRKKNYRRRATMGSTKSQKQADSSASNNFYMTRIPIGNLLEHQVLEILMDVLSMDEEKSAELASLANICFRKTHGNPFFLIQFLLHLQQENMLEYNFGLLKWIWSDEAEIETRTASTANVVDLVKSKMAALPDPNVVQLLTILACLGSSFQKDIVKLVWENYWIEKQLEEDEGETEDVPSVDALLASATAEGYLERLSAGRNNIPADDKPGSNSSISLSLTRASPSSSYHFVHDNIQEAALSLSNQELLPKLKSTLGKILVYELDCAEEEHQIRTLESYLFSAVNLLNEGLPPESREEKLYLAEMNLRAAKRAIAFSGFNSAAAYLSSGIELLPSNREKWTDEFYPLTLEMYSSAVEVHGYLGSVDLMQMYCDEVLAQRQRPLVDKFRVYNVLQGSMFNRSKENESVDLGLSLLRRLGLKFPNKKTGLAVSTHAGIRRIKVRVESKTFEAELANLPREKDPSHLETMHLLDKTSLYCFFSRSEMFPVLMLKMVQLTLKNGLCEYSPPAFANLGLLLAGMLGDYEAASKVADLTMKLMDQIPCRNTRSRTILILNWAVHPWSRPLRTVLNPFLKGYREGLSAGDTESALWCIHNYISYGLLCGRNLALLDDDSNTYLKHIIALEQHKIAKYTKMIRQMILNFRGLGISPTYFAESHDEDDLTSETTTTMHFDPLSGFSDDEFNDEPLMRHALRCYQNRLHTIFGEHEKSAQLSIDRGDEFLRSFGGNCLHMSDAFYRALSLYSMARDRQEPIDVERQTAQMCVPYSASSSVSTRGSDARTFKHLAKEHHSTIKLWVKKGNLNVIHYDRVLDAESAALKRRDTEAKAAFQNAIVMAAKSGFVQDAGLACERFGEFLLNDVKDRENAIFRFEQAIQFYTEWGSSLKAKIIKAKYPSLFPREKELADGVEAPRENSESMGA